MPKTSRPLLIAASLLLLLAVACSADKKPASDSNAGSTAQGTTANSSAGTTGASDNEVTALYKNFSSVKSFRADVTIATTASGQQQAQLEYAAPDKLHMTVSGGAASFEVITIGSDTYMKVGGAWTKQSAPTGLSVVDPSSIGSAVQSLGSPDAKVSKGATATVNGKSCQIYNSTTSTGTEEFCVADGLPLRVVTKSSGNTVTIVFTDYNSNVDIKAPIKAHQG